MIRQLVAENLLLAVLGGAVGLALAWFGVKALVALSPPTLPRLAAVSLDAQVVGFTGLLVLGSALVTGLLPALYTLKSDLHGAVRSGAVAVTTTRARHRSRAGLVAAEVALALTLMAAAGLLFRSVNRLLAVDVGFDASHLLTLTVQTSGPAYTEDAAVHAMQQRLLEVVGAVPGVRTAGLATQVPLGGNFDRFGIRIQDKPISNPADAPGADRYTVGGDYVAAMGIPLRRGRLLGPADRADAPPVVLVNEAMARLAWPGEDPIGKRIQMGAPDGPWREVVGVVGNVRHVGLDAGDTPQFYTPLAQWPWVQSAVVLVVRTLGDPAVLTSAVREAVWSVDRGLAISDVATMDELVALSAAQRRFAMLVFQSFAVVALLLAAAGLYGVLSGSVVERSRELGIRAALGATRERLLRLVLREGLILASIGLAVGGLSALALARLLRRLLFGVQPHDPATFATVALLVLGVAAVACLAPAWRAAQVDPVVTLKG